MGNYIDYISNFEELYGSFQKQQSKNTYVTYSNFDEVISYFKFPPNTPVVDLNSNATTVVSNYAEPEIEEYCED